MQSNPQPGTVLAGRYRLVRVLGEGGMGVVLEAENIATERRVAVKWLHSSLASNPEALQRLMREATATCRIRHPNVVDVYDVLRDGDTVYLIMELLEGETLASLLARGGMPMHELVALLIPAMRGVAEAHRLGIVHRDIHPANIFLAKQSHDPRPVPKVLDFGISKVGGHEGPSLTRSGTTLGTPLYMSYEQLCSARDVDMRTDVYSFGIVLYEALTGHPAYDGETFAELAIRIATATPVPPKQLRPEIPTALERIILWAMERNRDQRIPDLATLISELEPFASQHTFRGQMTDSERALPSVGPRAERASAAEPELTPPLGSERPPPAGSERRLDTLGHVSSPLGRSVLRPPSASASRWGGLTKRRALLLGMVAALALLIGAGLLLRSSLSMPIAASEPDAPSEPVASPLPEPAQPAGKLPAGTSSLGSSAGSSGAARSHEPLALPPSTTQPTAEQRAAGEAPLAKPLAAPSAATGANETNSAAAQNATARRRAGEPPTRPTVTPVPLRKRELRDDFRAGHARSEDF